MEDRRVTSPANRKTSAPKSAFRVLVIDDDETDREVTIRHLSKAWPFDHELVPEAAVDGEEAMQKIRASRFALVVLDWKLPGMNGAEVLRAIRSSGVRTPVVVMSGLQRAQILEDLDAFGAGFLNKDNITPVTFREAIATSLRLLGITPAATTAVTGELT